MAPPRGTWQVVFVPTVAEGGSEALCKGVGPTLRSAMMDLHRNLVATEEKSLATHRLAAATRAGVIDFMAELQTLFEQKQAATGIIEPA